MKQPHHIKMIKKLPIHQRSQEEKLMLTEYEDGKGDYGPTGAWDTTANGNVLGFETSKPQWNNKAYKRCYEDHPALPIKLLGGATRLVYGGSCGTPIHSDADVYVGLDWKMAEHKCRLPWVDGEAIHYEIQDMGIPKDLKEFRTLILWIADQIKDNKKVHIGCIGGHGRTGTVLAALVAVMMPTEKDPIGYVREHYCKKAVESSCQIQMLVKEYGCKEVAGSKSGGGGWKGGGTPSKKKVPPVKSKANVFGTYVVEDK